MKLEAAKVDLTGAISVDDETDDVQLTRIREVNTSGYNFPETSLGKLKTSEHTNGLRNIVPMLGNTGGGGQRVSRAAATWAMSQTRHRSISHWLGYWGLARLVRRIASSHTRRLPRAHLQHWGSSRAPCAAPGLRGIAKLRLLPNGSWWPYAMA